MEQPHYHHVQAPDGSLVRALFSFGNNLLAPLVVAWTAHSKGTPKLPSNAGPAVESGGKRLRGDDLGLRLSAAAAWSAADDLLAPARIPPGFRPRGQPGYVLGGLFSASRHWLL